MSAPRQFDSPYIKTLLYKNELILDIKLQQ